MVKQTARFAMLVVNRAGWDAGGFEQNMLAGKIGQHSAVGCHSQHVLHGEEKGDGGLFGIRIVLSLEREGRQESETAVALANATPTGLDQASQRAANSKGTAIDSSVR